MQNTPLPLETILNIISDPRFIVVFCAGVLYQKLTVISAEISYTKKWRHWAANGLMMLANNAGIDLGGQPE